MSYTPKEGDSITLCVTGDLTKDTYADYWTITVSPTARVSVPGSYFTNEDGITVNYISHTETAEEKIARLEAELEAKNGNV